MKQLGRVKQSPSLIPWFLSRIGSDIDLSMDKFVDPWAGFLFEPIELTLQDGMVHDAT
jgi:hypothetical protein